VRQALRSPRSAPGLRAGDRNDGLFAPFGKRRGADLSALAQGYREGAFQHLPALFRLTAGGGVATLGNIAEIPDGGVDCREYVNLDVINSCHGSNGKWDHLRHLRALTSVRIRTQRPPIPHEKS